MSDEYERETEIKQKTIISILVLFAEMYQTELSERYLETYVRILMPYPIDKIQAAADHIIRTKTFNKYPLPAEFIQHIDPPDQLESMALNATLAVHRKVGHRGTCYSVKFDDPVIHHVIDSYGGWIPFVTRFDDACASNKELYIFERDFRNRYVMKAGSPDLGQPPRLIGTHERDNMANGWMTSDGMLRLPGGGKELPEFIEDLDEFRKQISFNADISGIVNMKGMP